MGVPAVNLDSLADLVRALTVRVERLEAEQSQPPITRTRVTEIRLGMLAESFPDRSFRCADAARLFEVSDPTALTWIKCRLRSGDIVGTHKRGWYRLAVTK